MINFFSQKLSQTIPFDEVQQLSEEQLQDFHAELKEVVRALDAAVTDAAAKERSTGVPPSADWLHRINTKRRIAMKFAAEVYSKMHGGTTVEQRAEYERMYRSRFRAMLEEEFGAAELGEIERELIAETKKEYQDWIAKSGQRAWFTP
jgi:hypothetical protein